MNRTMNVAILTSVLALAAGCATQSTSPGQLSALGVEVVDCPRAADQYRCVIPLRVQDGSTEPGFTCTVYAPVGTIKVNGRTSDGTPVRIVWRLMKDSGDSNTDLSLYEYGSEGIEPEKPADRALMLLHFKDRDRETDVIELDTPPARRFRWVSWHIRGFPIHYRPNVLRDGKRCFAKDPIIRNLG